MRVIKRDHILSGGLIRKVILIACGLGKWFLVDISVQMRGCKGHSNFLGGLSLHLNHLIP